LLGFLRCKKLVWTFDGDLELSFFIQSGFLFAASWFGLSWQMFTFNGFIYSFYFVLGELYSFKRQGLKVV